MYFGSLFVIFFPLFFFFFFSASLAFAILTFIDGGVYYVGFAILVVVASGGKEVGCITGEWIVIAIV